jgi:hypothetical protein
MPNPRTDCPTCGRDVAIDSRSNKLYQHGDPATDRICRGSGAACYPDEPNESANAVSDWREPEPGTLPAGETPVAELAAWWRNLADEEIAEVVVKATEYGATDLRDLGAQILEMAGRGRGIQQLPCSYDQWATEIGIAFYAMGKLARIAAAIKEGRRPSYDSWHDLGVYARMAQRVHQVGAWPGVDKPILARRTRAFVSTTDEQIEQARQDARANGWDETVLQRVLDGLKSDNWGKSS